MKQQFICRFGVGLLLTFSLSSTFAQDTKSLPEVTVTSSTHVSSKVAKLFEAQFAGAESAKWSRINKDYLVNFITGDMRNRALLTKRGNLIYHIRYGHENNLPNEVRQEVKRNYIDYTITEVFNVKENNRDIWIVNLEGNNSLVIVRVEDGSLEEVNKYTNYQKAL